MKNEAPTHRYDDIIHLPHPVSSTHPQMPRANRAAQFAPFAALSGHEDAVRETARLTEEKAELDETAKAVLNEALRHLTERPGQEAKFTYFVQDKTKTGGAYVTQTASVRKLDAIESTVTLSSGTVLPMDDLYSVDLLLP